MRTCTIAEARCPDTARTHIRLLQCCLCEWGWRQPKVALRLTWPSSEIAWQQSRSLVQAEVLLLAPTLLKNWKRLIHEPPKYSRLSTKALSPPWVQRAARDCGVRLRCWTPSINCGVRLRHSTALFNCGVGLRCSTAVLDSVIQLRCSTALFKCSVRLRCWTPSFTCGARLRCSTAV